MNTHDIELPQLPRPQVPRIDADIDLMDIRRLAAWCEKTAKDYARAAIEAGRKRWGGQVYCCHPKCLTSAGCSGSCSKGAPQPTSPIGYITPAAVVRLREGNFVSLCPTDIDKGLPVYLTQPADAALREMVADHDDDTPAACYVEALIEAEQERYSADPNPPESPDSCDAQRWQKARTLPRSWWRDAFNRIAAEGVTLDELIDAEMRRKLP